MIVDDVIKVIENERECVRRQRTPCDRKCQNCDLVLPDSDIISAYNYCLVMLNDIRRTLKEVNEQ